MDFLDVVRRRRMVRAYRPEPVDHDVLARILDVARRGPSAGFAQGLDFVVVTERERREAVARVCGEQAARARGLRPWLSAAPVHVVLCVSEHAYRARYAMPDKAGSRGPDSWQVPYWWVDAGAGLMLLLLAAVNEGLAAGFLDVADHDGLRALLAIPSDRAPLGIVTVGHAEQQQPLGSAARARRLLDDVVHEERWRG